MRIIAGRHRGAKIFAPSGETTRPTGDKVRGAIFNMLGPVDGLKTLDLFAGSGALGLEAASRGAASSLLVDNRPQALQAIDRNITKLKEDTVLSQRRDYLAFLKDAAKKGQRYDLIFIDPPYKMHRVIHPELKRWLPQVISERGRVVVESSAGEEVSLPGELVKEKVYGDTRVRIFEFRGRPGADDLP